MNQILNIRLVGLEKKDCICYRANLSSLTMANKKQVQSGLVNTMEFKTRVLLCSSYARVCSGAFMPLKSGLQV